MRLRGALLLAVAAGVVGVLALAGPASAANLHCGQDLTGSVTLIGNLDCSSYHGTAIKIAHNGVTLNLNGYSIKGGVGYDVIRNFTCPSGDCTSFTGTTIKGGTLYVLGDDLGIGNDNGGGNNLTVAGVKIIGDGTAGSTGIDSEGSSGLSVTGGSISGVEYGVYLVSETGDLIKGNTITPNDGGYGVDSGRYNTAASIVSNKFTDTDSDQTGYAYYGQYDAGTLFSGNTVTKMGYGIYDSEYSAGLTVTGNVMDGNGYGIYLDEYDSGDVFAGNYIKNSVNEGIYDEYSFNNTYTGNVLTSNGTTANNESYYIYPDGYGPVTMVNNYARTGDGYGFYVYYAYNDTVPGGPYSLFSGNVATANGSSGNDGFFDEYSVGATWSKNVANYNATNGFTFDYPWRETITGNAATMNGGNGFAFEDNNEDYQPLAVTNNTATYNGGFGFYADTYPVAGSGNTGNKTNAEGDCYIVSGCS